MPASELTDVKRARRDRKLIAKRARRDRKLTAERAKLVIWRFRRLTLDLVGSPRNALRTVHADGNVTARYTLADAWDDPLCWAPAAPGPSAAPALVRRTPAARPAARRPGGRRRTAASRDGPSDLDDGEPEPPGDGRRSSDDLRAP